MAKDTETGMVRAGDNPTTAYSADIQVEIPAHEVDADGARTFHAQPTGGAAFVGSLPGMYQFVEVGGRAFKVLSIAQRGKELVIEVEPHDMGESAFIP